MEGWVDGWAILRVVFFADNKYEASQSTREAMYIVPKPLTAALFPASCLLLYCFTALELLVLLFWSSEVEFKGSELLKKQLMAKKCNKHIT